MAIEQPPRAAPPRPQQQPEQPAGVGDSLRAQMAALQARQHPEAFAAASRAIREQRMAFGAMPVALQAEWADAVLAAGFLVDDIGGLPAHLQPASWMAQREISDDNPPWASVLTAASQRAASKIAADEQARQDVEAQRLRASEAAGIEERITAITRRAWGRQLTVQERLEIRELRAMLQEVCNGK